MDRAHQHRPVTPVGRAPAAWPRALARALPAVFGWSPTLARVLPAALGWSRALARALPAALGWQPALLAALGWLPAAYGQVGQAGQTGQMAASSQTASQAASQFESADEAAQTVAFLVNIGNYTQWPAAALGAAGKPVTLCLMGDTESLSQALAALDGRAIQGRAVRVRHMSHLGLPAGCQLLYVARSEQRHLAEILPAAHAGAALTVSAIADFTDAGGIVGLSLADGRLDFDVNAAAARQAGLRLGSQVLKLARSVAGR